MKLADLDGRMPKAGLRHYPRQLPRSIAARLAMEHFCTPPPEAVALLGEVMSFMAPTELPVVQFIAASAWELGNDVARSLAIAAVARMGRTLLISGAHGAELEAGPPKPGARSPARDRGKLSGLVPDAIVPGLYHIRLSGGAAEAARLAQDAQAGWPGAATEFRMVVIESAAPHICPETLLICPASKGVVLTVAAGIATLHEIRASVRQIENAGGVLLGTVLHDAPKFTPRWPWRRRAF